MESLYHRLVYRHHGPESSWIGNLRWFALEEDAGSWSFHSAPMDEHHGRNPFQSLRDHFTLTLCSPGLPGDYIYGADRVTARFSQAAAELIFPLHDYGAMIRLSGPCRITFPRPVEAQPVPRGLLLRDQGYALCFLSDAALSLEGDSLTLTGGGLLTIGFSNSPEAAEQAARSLLENSSRAQRASRLAWEEYLSSCPIHITGDREADTRQLWHWWCALQNLSLVDFNTCRCYLAPDKCNWFGSWSNDSPEVLAALSLTSASHLARQGIIDYIRCAISPEGIQGWYTHADGRSSYGIPGDPGSHSQGVACIAHTVDYYVRATGDLGILREDVGGCSLWEKLKCFVHTFLDIRDLNRDGLIDCANIWESGWDDRLCPFFEKKSLDQWVQVITRGTGEEIRDFYKAWQMPVTVMAEQVYGLWALKAMVHLARLLQERDTESFCRRAYDAMLTGVRDRLWNPEDGFYHDLDLNRNTLSHSCNLDAFYFLYFEKDPRRIEEMVSKLKDPRKFGLPYLPTTAADHPGFRETGYWCGGHWPREMSYVGLALWEAGQQELARHYVFQALMTGEGNQLYENLNSLTGQPQTRPRRMAYDVLLMAALAHMDGKLAWTED